MSDEETNQKNRGKQRMSPTCEILPQKNADVNRNADDTDTGNNEIAVEWYSREEK
jgi:hypothetical protein